MKNIVATGQVSGQVEAQVMPPARSPVTSPVGGRPESRPEWKPEGFSKGGWTFLSANKKLMAGWETRPPVIKAEVPEMDKELKEILEKIGV